ncbi:hypothetical protein [Eubacterium sp. AF17-7]|uniref:hypothetical protein n=1 Tax=Eubacterium sp. AF17-7 TaxID=2293105 RepID=UPI0011C19CC7|nr:hypothetical protein [Eubacterium sp. AF17-7]
MDGELNNLPQMFRLYSLDDMEEAIENEERYGKAISRLEKVSDRIKTAKEISLLEYETERDGIEPDEAQDVEDERVKIRPEVEQQVKEELVEMYGRDFDGVMLEQAIVKADEELGDGATEEKVYIREKEKIRG